MCGVVKIRRRLYARPKPRRSPIISLYVVAQQHALVAFTPVLTLLTVLYCRTPSVRPR